MTMSNYRTSRSQATSNVSEREARSMLLGKDGNITPEFEAVLEKVYHQFAKDGGMGSSQLKEFSRICNIEKEFSDKEIEEIQAYFQCDSKRRLTLRGFKDMYHTQSSAEPTETWCDITNLGYADEMWAYFHDSVYCNVCKVPSNLVCSRCKKARYCSEACQKKSWKEGHKEKCIAHIVNTEKEDVQT